MGHPNIVLFVTDQQRRDTIGAYGSTICKTPTADRITAEGITFDRAYTPTGLCSPARSSLMSGVYPHAHKVLTNVALHPVRESLPSSQDRFARALTAADYRLGYVGKWHVSDTETPLDFGFHDYVGLSDYMAWRQAQPGGVPEGMWNYRTQTCARDPGPVETSRPAWLCDRAIELIEKYAEGDDPFFVRVDFHGPHFPNVVPEPYFSMYPPKDIPPWPNFGDDLADKPAVQRIKQRHWQTDGMTWADWQPLVSAYLGEVSLIDAQAGRVLDRLRDASLLDDTLVIWTTDHGDTCGSHGICNKDYTMYQEIYRVPLLMRLPGVIAPNRRDSHFVHHFLDLCATIVDLVGGDAAGLHGRSLLPILNGEDVDGWPTEAYCQFHGSHMGLYSMRMLCDDRYSYIYHANDIDEFYDLEADPHELANLAEAPGAAAGALEAKRRRMVEWMAATEDHLYNEWTAIWLTGDEKAGLDAPGRRRTGW